MTPLPDGSDVIDVSVVVPVYRGALTVPALVAELAEHLVPRPTPDGLAYRVAEVVLVWDHGPDESDVVLRRLDAEFDWVRVVWLSRNFGQHPATVAGMAASGSRWVVTMDEDGQHDPAEIPRMIDAAHRERAQLVYGAPSNPPGHGRLRNSASRFTKRVVLPALSGKAFTAFHSYRLIAGDAARAVAAYAGPGVYLDIALGWVISDVTTIPVVSRVEGRAAQNYNIRGLLSHFWRLVLSSGNRPLRVVSLIGVLCAVGGLLYAAGLVVARLAGATEVEGWTSTIVALLVIGGLMLISLGVIAEYVGLAASMSMGKPGFVVLGDPERTFAKTGSAPRR